MTFNLWAFVTTSCRLHVLLHRVIFALIFTFSAATSIAGDHCHFAEVSFAHLQHKNDHFAEENARSYIDEPLEQLTKRIPGLNTLQPAADQQQLSAILGKTAEKVGRVI
jgi:hypothetical protein